MRRWLALEDRAHTGDDTREFGPAHDLCRECGACSCEDCDGHEINCSHHPDFYEPPDMSDEIPCDGD